MSASGQVLNASQTAYAARVEQIIEALYSTEAPFPGAYIIYAMSQGWNPAECVANGIELAS